MGWMRSARAAHGSVVVSKVQGLLRRLSHQCFCMLVREDEFICRKGMNTVRGDRLRTKLTLTGRLS